MHSNEATLVRLFTCLNDKDHAGMASCYAEAADFSDIAFSLHRRRQIQAMWHLIAQSDLRATFQVIHADDQTGEVQLNDSYTFSDTGRTVRNRIQSHFRFSDGLIVEHRDRCDALRWGVQALGPVKGLLSWLFPKIRKERAMAKLAAFIAAHPEYAEPV